MNSLNRNNAALSRAQIAYDYAEPPIDWIETKQGLQYLQEGVRALMMGHDASTVKAADFIVEFSQQRNEVDEKDETLQLDWAIVRGNFAPRMYEQLAKQVARKMLYDKRDEAEAKLLWLVQ